MEVELRKLVDLIVNEGAQVIACGDGGDSQANKAKVNGKALEMLHNGDHLWIIKGVDEKVAQILNGKVILEPDYNLEDVIDWNFVTLALPEDIGAELYKEATVGDVELDEFFIFIFDSNDNIDFYGED